MAKKKVELKELDDLKPANYNPRSIGPAALSGLKRSLEMYGDISGITWNRRTGNLVTGHQRMRSLREEYGDELVLHIEDDEAAIETPDGERFRVRIVDWDPAKEKAANIAANQERFQGHFEDDQLAELLADLKNDGVSIDEATGFDDKDLDRMLGEAADEALDEDDFDPGPTEGVDVDSQFGVIVICADEAEQEAAYNALSEQFDNVKVVNV